MTMLTNVPNFFYWIAAGALIFGGVFFLRFILKFAWKIIRVVLIFLAIFLVAGYSFGFLDIIFQ
jgi:hypothetical protein